MQHIFKTLQTTLKKKSTDRIMLARLLLNELTNLIGDGKTLQWYLNLKTLGVYHADHQFSIMLFAQKKEFLTILNAKLLERWYDLQLRDIRVVPQRDEVQWNEEGEIWNGIEE